MNSTIDSGIIGQKLIQSIISNSMLRGHTVFLALVLGAGIVNAQQSSNDIPYDFHHYSPIKPGNVELILEPPETNYFAGQPVMLHIIVKNLGEDDGDVIVEDSLILYDAVVTFTNKVSMPPTPKGKMIIQNSRTIFSGGHVESLKPGETTPPLDYPLSKIFDLNLPGTYRVKVAREFQADYDTKTKQVKLAKVISNEVEITIVDTKAQ